MAKNIVLVLFGIVLGAGAMFAKDFQTESVAPTADTLALEQSFDALASAVTEAGEFVQTHQWYDSPQEQAEAYRHIVRVLLSALEIKALSDPDFPFFHELNPFSKSGMDNSDQRYLITMLNGEGVYRIWGSRGSSKRLDFTVYEAGSPMAPSHSTLTTEQLELDEYGNFEVFIGGEPRERNWLANASGESRLLIRQIHSNWSIETPGDIHIDRIDEGRPLYPALTMKKMATRLRNTADSFAADVRRWPELSRTRFSLLMPANVLTPPQDTGKEGGLAGRWMVGGHFELAENQALLIRTKATEAAYQGIQLGHHWWESLDYANRQTSLTTDQATQSSDGYLYFVLAAKDPGVANWLDTEGFQRGVIMMRFDGLERTLSDAEKPTATLLDLAEVRDHLPADDVVISAAQRAEAIAQRRKHVQQRFGF